MTTNAKTRVAVLTNDHEFTVRHREPLLRYLSEKSWDVVGISPGESPATKAFVELGFETFPVVLSRKGTNLFTELSSLLLLVRALRRVHPDLVINATIKPVIYGTIAARWLNIPVLNLITGLGYAYIGAGARVRFTRAIVSLLYWIVFGYSKQRVVLQNGDDRRELLFRTGLHRRRAVVVPGSGVDIDRFSPETCSCSSEETEEIVVLPARMLYDKGITTFVECARYLRDRSLTVRFVLVGPADPGNPAAVPLSQLLAWDKTDVVEWWGPIADIRTAFRRAAVVVLPSKREGMPKIVIEASACGIPVVTTDVPGCRDSVVDGKTGFLVPEGDVRSLAARIEVLLHDEPLRKRMGAAAHKLAVDRFAAPLVVRQIFEEASAMI